MQEDCDPGQFIHDNDKHDKNDDVLKKKNEEFQKFLRENLPNINYSEAQQRFSELIQENLEMQSTYLIFKEEREKVKLYKIKKCEYGNNNQETPTTLSENLCCDKNGVIHMNTNSDVPEFLFGASLPIDEAVNMIHHRIGGIIPQIPNATMDDALGMSMLLGCADTAEMDSLPSKRKHVTSFSIVPCSMFWSNNALSIHHQYITFCLLSNSIPKSY